MTDEFKIDAKSHIRTIRALVEAAKTIAEIVASDSTDINEKTDLAFKAQIPLLDEVLTEIDALHEKAEK